MDLEGDKPADAEGSAKPERESETRSPDVAKIAASGLSPNGPLDATVALVSAEGPALIVPAPREHRQTISSPRPRRPSPGSRRVKLPAILFVATCLSTFVVGMTGWDYLALISE